jgi:hypothetical protein
MRDLRQEQTRKDRDDYCEAPGRDGDENRKSGREQENERQ